VRAKVRSFDNHASPPPPASSPTFRGQKQCTVSIRRDPPHCPDGKHCAAGAHLAAMGVVVPPARDRYAGGTHGVKEEGAPSGGRHGGRGTKEEGGVARLRRPLHPVGCP